MPSVKDFKDKSGKKSKNTTEVAPEPVSAKATEPKRRPGRQEIEASEADIQVVDVQEGPVTGTQFEEPIGEEANANAGPKVEIKFSGSETIRARFPQPFDIVEAVATDWVHGGNFEKLPIDHPLAQYVAKTGLQKAKEIEKKVLESPVTEKVAMQVLTAGMKAQGLFEKVRSKIKK